MCRFRATGRLVDDLGLRFSRADWRGALVGLGSQFLVLPILYLFIEAFVSRDLTKDLEAPARDLTNDARGAGFFVLAVLLIFGAPLVEELFYRGLLLKALKRHLPAPLAVIGCGIGFGAAHFNLVTLPGLAVFGIVLAILAHRSGRLGSSIVAHAAFNATTVAFLWNA